MHFDGCHLANRAPVASRRTHDNLFTRCIWFCKHLKNTNVSILCTSSSCTNKCREYCVATQNDGRQRSNRDMCWQHLCNDLRFTRCALRAPKIFCVHNLFLNFEHANFVDFRGFGRVARRFFFFFLNENKNRKIWTKVQPHVWQTVAHADVSLAISAARAKWINENDECCRRICVLRLNVVPTVGFEQNDEKKIKEQIVYLNIYSNCETGTDLSFRLFSFSATGSTVRNFIGERKSTHEFPRSHHFSPQIKHSEPP